MEDNSLVQPPEGEEITVGLGDLEDEIIFEKRNELKKMVNRWAEPQGFKMVYIKNQRYVLKSDSFINKMVSHKYYGKTRGREAADDETDDELSEEKKDINEPRCKFFLSFEEKDGKNKLIEYNNKHSHKLDHKGKSQIRRSIEADMDILREKTRSTSATKDVINAKHNSQFSYHDIYYLEKKSSVSKNGKPADDAKNLIKLLNERKERGDDFKYSANQNNQLKRLLYIPKFGREGFWKFYDVMVIDSTLKTNRFNMAFVNLIGINNNGENLPFGFGLVSTETEENYSWPLDRFQDVMGRSPKLIMSDECPSITAGKHYSVLYTN